MTGVSVAASLGAAGPGPTLTAQLFPLSAHGNVRASYNWRFSALNVDPNDASPFVWVFQKTEGGSVALSPRDGSDGSSAWASKKMPDGSVTWSPPDGDLGEARWATAYPDEHENFANVVQMQVPEADSGYPEWNPFPYEWTLTGLGLLTVELWDTNGYSAYIGVNESITTDNDHAGYLILSRGTTPDLSCKFLVAVQQNLQAAVHAPLFSSFSEADVSAELARQGHGDPQTLTKAIFAATGR